MDFKYKEIRGFGIVFLNNLQKINLLLFDKILQHCYAVLYRLNRSLLRRRVISCFIKADMRISRHYRVELLSHIIAIT